MTGVLKKGIFVFALSMAICLAFLEILFRVYNPLQSRVRRERIVLAANQKYVYENTRIPRLDARIVHTKNSLGFRGDEPPKGLGNYLSIITVGGSTTECFYLSDEKTWPYLLGQKLKNSFTPLWLNNAGMDGFSTFGVSILLKDYISALKPKVVLFMVGLNDIDRDDLNMYDKKKLQYVYLGPKDFILKNSEVASVFVNMLRVAAAYRRQLLPQNIDISGMGSSELPPETIERELEKRKNTYIAGYKKRVVEIISLSRKNAIEPVFITQPALWGEGVDDVTGVNLRTVKLYDGLNGVLFWKILSLYNAATKDACRENNVLVIDLAAELPKSSRYFYDGVHCTNEGARKISEVLYVRLQTFFLKRYKPFERGPGRQ